MLHVFCRGRKSLVHDSVELEFVFSWNRLVALCINHVTNHLSYKKRLIVWRMLSSTNTLINLTKISGEFSILIAWAIVLSSRTFVCAFTQTLFQRFFLAHSAWWFISYHNSHSFNQSFLRHSAVRQLSRTNFTVFVVDKANLQCCYYRRLMTVGTRIAFKSSRNVWSPFMQLDHISQFWNLKSEGGDKAEP